VEHNTALNSSDNPPSYSPDIHHSSDDVYWRGGRHVIPNVQMNLWSCFSYCLCADKILKHTKCGVCICQVVVLIQLWLNTQTGTCRSSTELSNEY